MTSPERWSLLRIRAALVLFLAAAAHALSALAAAQADGAQGAEALFDQGRKLMAERNYEEACPKFAASHHLDPALGTLLNLAYCWKQLGKTASAWTAYREAASLALWQHQPEREAFARTEAGELEARVARLKLRVEQPDQGELEVRRDGAIVPRALWGMDVPVDPGAYRIEAAAPHHSSFAAAVTVLDGQSVELTIPGLLPVPEVPGEAAADPSAPVATPARAPNGSARDANAAPRSSDKSSLLSTLAIGTGAVGLAAFGLSGVFALRMHAQDTQAREICKDEPPQCTVDDVTAHERHKQAARTSRTAAYATASIGAACAAGAVVLFLAAKYTRKAPRVAAGQGLTVEAAPGAFVVLVRGRM